MKRFRAAAAFALLLSAAACDSTGPDPDEGVLAFTYSGAESGTFEARGEPARGVGWRSFAAGGVFSGSLRVEAWDGGTVADLFYLFVSGAMQPGTYRFAPPGTEFFNPPNSDVFSALVLDLDRRDGDARRSFDLTSGTLVVEEVTDERIRGRFQGTAADPANPTAVITIADGHFDVPNTLDPPIID